MNDLPLLTDNAVVLGVLLFVLGIVFHLSSSDNRLCKKVFRFIPPLLLCYLLPSLLSTFNIISPKNNDLWQIAKDYFLPAALILMTLSIDLKSILGLGPKMLIMFLVGTVGIILGGPLAILIVSTIQPDIIADQGSDATWRGFATLAGSWIGGGANQTAMLEIYGYNIEKYSTMIAIDILVANLWMVFLLYGAGNPEPIDRWLGADASSASAIKKQLKHYESIKQQYLSLPVVVKIMSVAFVGVGLAHALSQLIIDYVIANTTLEQSVLNSQFFWIVVISTTYGIALSFTRLRELESYGASKFGSFFIYLLVAIIGTKMQFNHLASNADLFLVGLIWMLFHVFLLFAVAKMIKAPFFFIAVGSKANVGGAASAPVVAAAFHPSLAPVGVLLAVLGYGLGTYGAILCAELMRLASAG